MKKIFALSAALLLSGCAYLASGPDCRYKDMPKVETARLAAVIGFADGSSAITPENEAILHKVAAEAEKGGYKVDVLGHASHRTATKDVLKRVLVNLKVSNERAVHTAAVLAADGVSPEDMFTMAMSDSRPLVSEVTRADEAANRRAEVYLYKLKK